MNVCFGSEAVIQTSLKLSEKNETFDLSNCGISIFEINFKVTSLLPHWLHLSLCNKSVINKSFSVKCFSSTTFPWWPQSVNCSKRSRSLKDWMIRIVISAINDLLPNVESLKIALLQYSQPIIWQLSRVLLNLLLINYRACNFLYAILMLKLLFLLTQLFLSSM